MSQEIVSKLEAILLELERVMELCKRGILHFSEASRLESDTDQMLKTILLPYSVPYRIYDSRRRRAFWEVSLNRDYVAPSSCENIEYWITVVQVILTEFNPEFLRNARRDKTQYFLTEGDFYRAKQTVYSIMKKAQKNLNIIDLYLDDEVFSYIESLNSAIEIKLITSDRKPIFKSIYKALRDSRHRLEARQNEKCHDRFIIIDEMEIWHLGASLNHIGKKATMINKILDQNELIRFKQKFYEWWHQGTVI